MAVPILKQGDYLIAMIQAALSDAELVELRQKLVERTGRFRSRGVIVDVTALDLEEGLDFLNRTFARKRIGAIGS